MRHTRGLPVAVAVAALAGCGSDVSWSASKVEGTVRTILTQQAGLQVRSVSCPTNVKIGKGVVAYCTASLANGDTVRFSATQEDSSGQVHVGPAEMIALEVQNRIEAALHQRAIKATAATCPQHVPITVGKTFGCTASVGRGQRLRIAVTITTPSGGFSMKLAGS
jgi:predicted small secreted protein